MPHEGGPKEWSPTAWLAVKVNAGHDVNGNPRRGWVMTNCRKGDMVDFVDEGYHGDTYLERQYPRAVKGPELKVTPGEYRDLKKFANDKWKASQKKKPELGKGPTMAKVKGKVPPVLTAWVACRKESGVKPGIKMTPKQKAEARTCVVRQLRALDKKKK
jgi:hypothetical protein